MIDLSLRLFAVAAPIDEDSDDDKPLAPAPAAKRLRNGCETAAKRPALTIGNKPKPKRPSLKIGIKLPGQFYIEMMILR